MVAGERGDFGEAGGCRYGFRVCIWEELGDGMELDMGGAARGRERDREREGGVLS